ncbi:MAG TPA: serine/threonine-protein kinase [Gemmataceae bacterium]|nr:serine/threonine-protein kinase [Gemmataceae bacterium]
MVRCPKGHVWGIDEFDPDAELAAPTAPVACPYCGALCTVAAEPLPATRRGTNQEPVPTDDPPRAEFPGYEILGVLGRGGMGIVYKARQVRTDRVVALKVPGHLDLETRVRLTTEAQAAARVSHANIVQVYEVGEHRGRPFLALEYVPGGTLADRLNGAPHPSNSAAALAETLARAVGAAHAHGVVHRDLKPANILISSKFQFPGSKSPDNLEPGTCNLELKVADFGLARRIDTDSGQTRSGAILGTPDYMAPEQAAGRNKEVGPPADVYALGAILYELLTGRPPFRGVGMLETLEQVRTLDPVPPRRLQPAVPRDLETICLKCLQKDPTRRYIAAGELADDLRRFLDGEPVRARPVSRLERWVKRARRNPLATGLAAALCLVLIAAVGYGVVYHLRLQAQRDRARYHFQMAVRSIEGLLTEVAEEDLVAEPRAELKRKALLEKALAFYEELLRVEPDDPELAWLAARGARRVGDIQRLLGRYSEALVAYDRSLERLAALADHSLPNTDPKREIADVHNFVGEVYRLRGEYTPAEEAYNRALNIQQPRYEADSSDPGYAQDLARTRYNLGIVAQQLGKPPAAVAELTAAARMLDGLPADDLNRRHHRARVYLNLGPALRTDRQLGAAEAECSQAIALYEGLAGESGGRPVFRHELAAALINRGNVRLSDRNPAGAKSDLIRARDLLAELVRDFRHPPEFRVDLAKAYNALAVAAFAEGRPDDGTKLFGEAVEVWDALVAQHDTPRHRGRLGVALGNHGRALEVSEPARARALLTRGVSEVLTGMRASPNDRDFLDALPKMTGALARLMVRAGDHEGVRQVARAMAVALPDRAVAAHWAIALLAKCVAATDLQKSPDAPAEVDRYVDLAVELVTAAGSANWSDLVADPDCAPLLARPAFARAVGR